MMVYMMKMTLSVKNMSMFKTQDKAVNGKLSKDGSDYMLAALDMNGEKIIHVPDTTFEDGDAINYRLFQRERLAMRDLVSAALPLDGTRPMADSLNMD